VIPITSFGGTVVSRSENTYTKTSFLAPGTTNPISTTNSNNILWGAAAAAAVGAFVAEAQRKREEQEAARRAAEAAAAARAQRGQSDYLRKAVAKRIEKNEAIQAKKRQAAAMQAYHASERASVEPPPVMPTGLSPEAQQAFQHSSQGAGWVVGNAKQLQEEYAEQLEREAASAQIIKEENKPWSEMAWNIITSIFSGIGSSQSPKSTAIPTTTPTPSVTPIGIPLASITTPTPVDSPTSTPTISLITPVANPIAPGIPLVEDAGEKKPADWEWLKKLNPPSWLSISGEASLGSNLFSDTFIGVTNVNRGIGEIMLYEEQNLKISNSVMGIRNPNGIVDINIANGNLTLSVGNYELFANPFRATVGATVKTYSTDNPNSYREDTIAHDWDFNWGWMTNSFVASHTNVVIDTTRSNEEFQVELRETLEGEVRTVKTTGIMVTTAFAVIIVSAVGAALGGISIGELMLQGVR